MTGRDVAEPQPLWLSLQHTPPFLGISDTPAHAAHAAVGAADVPVGVAHAAVGAAGGLAVAAVLVDALVVIADSAVVLAELADSAGPQFHLFPYIVGTSLAWLHSQLKVELGYH